MKTKVNGILLNVESAGAGDPPFLLIPPLGGSLRQWHAVAALLSPITRVVMPDLRGHGGSDRPEGPYSVKLFADDLAALCRSEGLSRCVAVGASIGGAIALQLAADHPELVAGVVTAGGFATMGQAGKDRMTQRAKEVETHGMAVAVDAVLAGALGPTTHATNPSLVGLQKAVLLGNDPKAYATATRAVVEADVRASLAGVKCPVMLVFGAEEKVAPLPYQYALKRGLPQAQIRCLPDAGHLCFLEKPGPFAAALMEFAAAI